jgi:hypothetical protein
MASAAKRIVLGSMVMAGIVVIAVVLDIVLGFPFGQKYVMDVMFLIGAALVLYMGYDAYQDLT